MKNLLRLLLDWLKSKRQVSVTVPLGTFSKPNEPANKLNINVSASGQVTESKDTSLPHVDKIKEDKKEPKVVPKIISTRHQFIIKLWPIALEIQNQYKLHPYIGITQAAHESNWGLSELTVKANNLFGMTAGSWVEQRRPVIFMPTTEYSKFPPERVHYWDKPGDILEKRSNGKGGSILKVNRAFRKYASWEFSMQDWAIKITSNPKYRVALESARTGDMSLYAMEMTKAGYATDTNYDQKLIGVHDVVARLAQEITYVV